MRAILCLALFCLPALAHAKCASRSISVWPTAEQALAPSGLLYVQGFGQDEAIIAGLKGAFLKTGKTKIPLVAIATHSGGMRVTQTVFRASKPLAPGKTYTLWLQGKTKSWKPTRWIDSGRAPVKWTVAEVPAAAWTGAPTVGKGSFRAFGCGPAIYQDVALPVTQRTGLVEVTIAGGKAEQRYILPVPPEGDLGLGHGMCSGPFFVGGESDFEASFALIDGAGQRIPAPGTVKFSGVQPSANAGR